MTLRRLFLNNFRHTREVWQGLLPHQRWLCRVCSSLHFALILPLLPLGWVYLRAAGRA